jgi:hypothetical protein
MIDIKTEKVSDGFLKECVECLQGQDIPLICCKRAGLFDVMMAT